MPLTCRVQWSWVDRTGDTVKQSQRRVTSPTVIEACLLTTRSKMFRQHLKSSLTAPRRSDVQEQAPDFFCFFLLSQLSEPGRLGTALSGPASRLASAMTFSGCDTSPTVDCCSFSICPTQSPEELGRVGERSLGWTDCRAATLALFFYAYTEKERTRRAGRQNSPLASQKLHPLRCMKKRDRECSQKCEQEDWAAVSGSERIAPYRPDQSRVEPYTTGFSQTSIFIPSPFSGRTNGAQWRQEESKFLPCFS